MDAQTETLPAPAETEAALTLRPITPLAVSPEDVGMAEVPPPTFEWVDPRDLWIDDAYQRALSDLGLALVRRIIGAWDWRRYKPPIVARMADGQLRVLDGQHTATAAASHPGIDRIPVMLVEAEAARDQAAAFVGLNTERLSLTRMQLHISAVAAGEPTALAVQAMCDRVGVRILRTAPAGSSFRPRETIAVAALIRLATRYDADLAASILGAVAEAEIPVGDPMLKAVELLLTATEYRGQVTPAAITDVLRDVGPKTIEREAKLFAATHGVRVWRAMAIVVYRRARKAGRRATAA